MAQGRRKDLLEPEYPNIRSRRIKPSQRTGFGRDAQEEMGAWKSLILLQIVASSGSFYCQCSDDEEAVRVMKRCACSGFDSKVIGIRDENIPESEISLGIV